MSTMINEIHRVDLKSLAKQNSLSVVTLRKFAKAGMPHFKVGNKILVESNEFEKWFSKFKKTKK